MNLTPWRNKTGQETSPAVASRMGQLRTEMDQLFDRFFSDPWSLSRDFWGRGSLFGGGWLPSVDVDENDKQVLVRIEVPGVDPGNIDVSVNGNLLTIRGEKKEESEEECKNCYRSERSFGSFERTIELPQHVDTEQVSAEHKNGVLTIALGKLKGAEPKKIRITAS